jgi:hypothetical protein
MTFISRTHGKVLEHLLIYCQIDSHRSKNHVPNLLGCDPYDTDFPEGWTLVACASMMLRPGISLWLWISSALRLPVPEHWSKQVTVKYDCLEVLEWHCNRSHCAEMLGDETHCCTPLRWACSRYRAKCIRFLAYLIIKRIISGDWVLPSHFHLEFEIEIPLRFLMKSSVLELILIAQNAGLDGCCILDDGWSLLFRMIRSHSVIDIACSVDSRVTWIGNPRKDGREFTSLIRSHIPRFAESGLTRVRISGRYEVVDRSTMEQEKDGGGRARHTILWRLSGITRNALMCIEISQFILPKNTIDFSKFSMKPTSASSHIMKSETPVFSRSPSTQKTLARIHIHTQQQFRSSMLHLLNHLVP